MRMFAKKRVVRLHFVGDSPSIEGIFLGTQASNYVLAKAELVREDSNVALEGETWIPKERVLFMQVTR
jgi:hypothetical protein